MTVCAIIIVQFLKEVPGQLTVTYAAQIMWLETVPTGACGRFLLLYSNSGFCLFFSGQETGSPSLSGAGD